MQEASWLPTPSRSRDALQTQDAGDDAVSESEMKEKDELLL